MDQLTELYKAFLNGDQSALTLIIRDCKDGLMLYLNTYVQNITVAEELTEDTFVKLVLKRPKFAFDIAFKTWLYRIGRNLALDYLRRNKHKNISLSDLPELADECASLERSYIQQEEKQMLHRTIKSLKKEYQQVLWLVYFEGFTHKETARIMEKTVHNVETLVYRARQSLKVKLLKEGYVYEKL